MQKGLANVSQLNEFDDIIDTRTPAEFIEDHIPGAINLPVLSNEQRVEVGTLHKHSAFEARRIGGAMVAENLSRHLYTHMQNKPKSWRPLVYCWRGGMRSGAFVTWLRLVGWDACQLVGGYKSFRHHVIRSIETFSHTFSFHVLGGATGSAKTRLLEALEQNAAQVLDLEGLAVHKGSVLGAIPGRSQPTQKAFETMIYEKLRHFDPALPVYAEAESRRIGRLQLPDALLTALHASACIHIDASRTARIEFLTRDYAYLGDNIEQLCARLDNLSSYHSKETLQRWKKLAEQRNFPALFGELIDLHYDPLYQRSQNSHFVRFDEATHFATDSLTPDAIQQLARQIQIGKIHSSHQ